MKIGHVHNGYPEVRNIFSVLSKKISHIKCIDIFKLRDFIHFKLFNNNNYYLHNSFNDKFSFPKADVYHFFNGVNYGNKPWVSTFETILPRYDNNDKRIKKAINAMAKPTCKKLIALSEFNKNLQLSFLKEHFTESYEVISSKIEVVYPPQKTYIDVNINKYHSLKPLKLLFVGHDFFRKGGREIFSAVEQMVDNGFKIELTVVSRLTTDNWISKTAEEDKLEWIEKLNQASFCTYFDCLNNDEVIRLMKAAHVFLMLSFQDTFGYVILEAQACGTPVISTNIRAFPEINNSDCGWLIDVPQTKKGKVDIDNNDYEFLSQLLVSRTKHILTSIIESGPNVLIMKSEQCIKRIKTKHNTENYIFRIEKIYKDHLL
jgi:glycosyltransferase involved in cell wall biosynthesis